MDTAGSIVDVFPEGAMTPEQAVAELCHAGLVARYDPERAFGEISAHGDPYDSDHEIRCYRWSCWAYQEDSVWQVALPPLLVPGPGPQFSVATLEGAVSLIRFAFARRNTQGSMTPREQFEQAHHIFDEWRHEVAK